MTTIKNNINTYADLTAYNADTNKDFPNVSYLAQEDDVLFGTDIIVAKFNVISTASGTRIMGVGKTQYFSKIWIDGVEQQSVVDIYIFSTTGEHTVKYSLVNKNTIGYAAFSGIVQLTSIILPNGISTIDDNAFGSCSGLTSITLPKSLTTIDDNAFGSCTGLTSITLPKSLTTIGNSAFYGCTGLTSVTIPNSVTTIGNGAFAGCNGLTSVTIDCNEYLSKDTYISSSVRKIFGTQVTTYIIGDSVTSIGNNQFNGCSNLTSVTIGNSVTTIGESAFSGCSGLTSVVIPDSVTTIEGGAFYQCGLTTLTLGTGVQYLYRGAFRSNPNLTNITSLRTNPPQFYNYSYQYPVFDLNITGRSIYVPSSAVNSYKAAQGWSDYANDIQAIPTT